MKKPLSGAAEVGEWPCSYCGRVFVNKLGLSSHVRAVHEPLHLPCPRCGQVFTTPQSFAQHKAHHDRPQRRFFEKVDKNGPVNEHAPHLGPCWIWQASTDTKGYGRFRAMRVHYGAHKFSWELVNGPVPKGLELDHLCRTPACCNPAHLEPVTHEENTRRGRDFARERGCPCDRCDFVAETNGGLAAHRRFRHADTQERDDA